MPQLSLYLDDESMESLREESKREGLSLSKYARVQLARTNGTWPVSFWSTYGSLDDETFTIPEESTTLLDGPLPSFDD